MKREPLLLFAAALLSCLLGAALRGLPYPIIHDEYSYLIQGSTFAQGRLAFPPPAFPEFFETFHVLVEPNYVSKYFPAQGVCLAFGFLLGHPIIAVWLNMGLVAVASAWMTRAYLPVLWGRVAAAITIVSFGFFHYFSQSYCGGGIPLLGGMLVIGGMGRLLRKPAHPGAHLAFLGGAFLLLFSRPYEGFFFCLIPGMVYLRHSIRLAGGAIGSHRRPLFLLLPAAAALLSLGILAAYNAGTTGHWSRLAYLEYHQEYFGGSLGIFQGRAEEVPAAATPDAIPQSFQDRLNLFLDEYIQARHARSLPARFLLACREWFVHNTQFLLPLLVLAALGACADRARWKILWATTAVGSIGILSTSAYWLHYMAPLLGTLILLSTHGLRKGLHWCRRRHLPYRRYLVEMMMLLVFANYFFSGMTRLSREKAESFFESLPGQHLVLVHYAEGFSAHDDWVYTLPPFSSAKTVWVRDLDIPSRASLLEQFGGRTAWKLELRPQYTRIHPLGKPEQNVQLEYPDSKKNPIVTGLRKLLHPSP